ncbi:hypothetical protein ACRE_048510 [Hapsidospora chrysogenum ATCC 11550]|uniref:Uncharacterized protein n=1 Tax=Hapsidospora chrysogenum (strain ATCC 11550 / CBS 779.69 / DSM 880 / IAM 14645 / JCM 23072 / IMI 49137) TaxID=857340 RepID=A0A086T4X6_HAPC1|nr:hypothetical protein ACRE_048510 [Hapsidospora chrysogenum ATCC 11550]
MELPTVQELPRSTAYRRTAHHAHDDSSSDDDDGIIGRVTGASKARRRYKVSFRLLVAIHGEERGPLVVRRREERLRRTYVEQLYRYEEQ